MAYQVGISRQAERSMARLSQSTYKQVRDSLEQRAHVPRPAGCKRLIDSAQWRLRVGDYRIIYNIDDAASTVLVLQVGHRSEVYR
jgi:mRNA interferase RelE/StbE